MRVFLAGATGATGHVFIPLAERAGHDLVLHVRPQTAIKSPLGNDPRARVFDLTDSAALVSAIEGCDFVLSLVGTMRARFDDGDTYASSDIASAEQLTAAARKSKSPPRFLLLSSHGAGGIGAYLKMKGECEAIVKKSGLAWTIFRPSALVSPDDGDKSAHGKRSAPPGASAVIGAIGALPGLRGWSDDVKPIPIEVLCRAFLRVIAEPERFQESTLEGRNLWAIGDHV
jgi:uncharacterized protein YbjT (DUF2867 family)